MNVVIARIIYKKPGQCIAAYPEHFSASKLGLKKDGAAIMLSNYSGEVIDLRIKRNSRDVFKRKNPNITLKDEESIVLALEDDILDEHPNRKDVWQPRKIEWELRPRTGQMPCRHFHSASGEERTIEFHTEGEIEC